MATDLSLPSGLPVLPETWEWVPLGSIVSEKISYGIVQPGPNDEQGVPIVRVTDIRNNRIDTTKPLHVAEQIEEKHKRTRLAGGELLLSVVGTLGETAIVPRELCGWNVNRAVSVLRIKSDIGPHWVQLALSLPLVREYMESWANTTVQKTFNLRDVARLPVPLPPKSVRVKITDVLSNINERVELNRQINQTLEQLAQAIFKNWFVDFEAVKAKQHVRSLGGNDEQTERAAQAVIAGAQNLDVIITASQLGPLDEQLIEALNEKLAHQTGAQREHLTKIASYFPDQLVESELGLIPRGWAVRSLDQIADFLNGVAAQKYPVQEGERDLPVIKIAELRGGFSAKTGRASRGVDPKYIINNGDLLFSWSGSLLVEQWSLGQGLLNQHIFKVTSNEFPKWFCHQWVCYHLTGFQQIAADKAVTMGHIKRSHLSEAKTIVPGNKLIEIGSELIGRMFEQELQNALESGQLARLRNALLPKLLSGELRVEEAA